MAATRIIGTILRKTSGTPFEVGGLTSLGGPGITRDEMDVTSFDSQDDFREWIATWKDAGDLAFEGYIKDATSLANMWSVTQDGNTEHWEIEFPLGQKWFFYGFVKEFRENDMTVDGVRGFTGSLRITGMPVYAESGISA